MIRTPNFWIKKNLISYLLLPLSCVYFFGYILSKIFSQKRSVKKPVICIGNLTAGGSGKTPTAIAIGKILQEININFAFLSRGYMNDNVRFLMLQKGENHNASKVGDEPLLLAEHATTFIAKNRFFAANRIEGIKKIDAIVLDDGMQNNSLNCNYTIMVVDGSLGFGNEFLLPAGPMREPLLTGLRKADIIVAIGNLSKNVRKKLGKKRILQASIKATNAADFKGKNLVAFAGIAYPKKFFNTLKNNGLQVVATKEFHDHYIYKNKDLDKLILEAQNKNAQLITTKKDWVKFSSFYRQKIAYLEIELEFENKELIKLELKKYAVN